MTNAPLTYQSLNLMLLFSPTKYMDWNISSENVKFESVIFFMEFKSIFKLTLLVLFYTDNFPLDLATHFFFFFSFFLHFTLFTHGHIVAAYSPSLELALVK